MVDLEKFRRHVGREETFRLESEDGVVDDFTIKPLSVELFAEFMIISENLNKEEEMDNSEMVKELFGLYVKILMESYPDLTKELAQGFIIKNFVDIVEIFNKMMPVKVTEEQRQKLQHKIKMMQNAKSKSENTQ